MPRLREAQILDPFSGKPFEVPFGGSPNAPLTTVVAIRLFFNAYAGVADGVTLVDSAFAVEVLAACRATLDGKLDHVELHHAEAEWLVEKFKLHGAKVFGLNASCVLFALRDTISEEATVA